jgi:hypothetical protein
MPKNHQLEELQLFKGIDKILHNHWLPQVKLPRNEYRQCHREVFQLVLGDTSAKALAQYLHDIVIEKAGWRSDFVDHIPAAESILQLKGRIMLKNKD